MPSLKLFLTSSERKRSSTSLDLEPTIQSKVSLHACEQGSNSGDRKLNRNRLRRARLLHLVSEFFRRKKANKEKKAASGQFSSARAIQRSRSQGGKRLRWASPLVQTSNSDVKLKRGAAMDAVTFAHALAFHCEGHGSQSGPCLKTEVEEDYAVLDEDVMIKATETKRQRGECTSLCGKTSASIPLDACAALCWSNIIQTTPSVGIFELQLNSE